MNTTDDPNKRKEIEKRKVSRKPNKLTIQCQDAAKFAKNTATTKNTIRDCMNTCVVLSTLYLSRNLHADTEDII